MYLKGIVTTGFKSFADKLDLKLDDKITCIVGPNGSGKSNIVDAVRWVLGEQSVKSLRGDGSMSDVIFSGSKSRNPLNVASVELILDNSDHYLNVPYTEISIKRRVYRSGENEYYLNNERCRLKDITNILLDSGMGKESYNIISQGEVEKILSDSPNERRIIFEEASGILKYKKRKEEALRKLDRTHNNIDRVNDIIGELENQIGPLKEQSIKAKEYMENKEGLDKYEVSLLSYDIENINNKVENDKKLKEKIDNEILEINNSNSSNDAYYMDDNNKLEKLEEENKKLNRDLLITIEEKTRIEGERNLLVEKNKSDRDDERIKEELRDLLDKKEKNISNINVVTEQLNIVNGDYDKKNEELKLEENKLDNLKKKKSLLVNDYSKHNQELIGLKHNISNLENEIENGSDMPNSVRRVLNSNLAGIYNTIGNLLSCEDKYVKALNTAIISCRNFIITKDENSAKNAINYLKDNHAGRATFFPLSVIKERDIDYDTKNIINNSPDYLGIMVDLVTYNREYDNVMKNQLGNVIVVTDMDAATRLSHMINAKYKIVTLDGDVVNVGGSLTGGSVNNIRSAVVLRQELNHLKDRYKLIEKEEEEIQLEIQDNDKEVEEVQELLFKYSKERVDLKEKLGLLNIQLKDENDKKSSIEKEINSLEIVKINSIDSKEQELIREYHEKNALKEQLEIRIKANNKEIDRLKEKLDNYQADLKLKNQKLHSLEKESRDLEISINRSDVRLDNMLNILSQDYELTYERAKSEYVLDIDPEEARKLVDKYRANIKKIGMVNLDSIEEYERVNSRYEFLTKQREDLLGAENTLLDIMNEMDEVMKEEFKNSFELIREEFKKVFKELFNGGTADLKLTDPDNLLTTGVEIVASPPGKKLTTISLLSGGEKTLTAISLLFAILNVRTVPFCLFDEVEAALDEANVSQFGKYLEHYKDKTQFLIITHKKKTMEYANTLYGFTMQESGVSKLVSVKLEDANEVI